MKTPNWQALPAPGLLWSGDTPRSAAFQDIYFSSESGLEEARHVFLRGNQLPEAWRGRSQFTVAEIGFGTGLNFLATWQAWTEDRRRCTRLHYLAIEKFPLRGADCARAWRRWPCLSSLGAQLLAHYPQPLPGRHRLLLADGLLTLDLLYADAATALETLAEEPNQGVDCWFADGFAPARNPQLWSSEIFASMAALSRSRASFATFTAAGRVRRGLRDAGFEVSRVAGFGSKREMLQGRYGATVAPRCKAGRHWHLGPQTPPGQPRAAVLGAGLAGAATAEALARRGWQVTVLEQNQVAAATSGNLQGILYTRVSHRDSHLNQFSIHSYCFALRHYRRLLAAGCWQTGRDGAFCGALQLREPGWKAGVLQRCIADVPELVRPVSAGQASAISGLKHCPGGLFYPGGGWLHPPAICAGLLRHPGITVRENCGPLRVARLASGWGLLDERGEVLHQSPTLVIATGHRATAHTETRWLPLGKIRGQVTHLPSSGELRQLATVICHTGYLAPARDGIHCIGATFDLGEADPGVRVDSHRANLGALRAALSLDSPDYPDTTESDALAGRVGFRCTSPDYLPVVGPVPDRAGIERDFAFLRSNARQVSRHRGSVLPGLYLNAAHGARGLTSTPLAAELLASQISGEAAPLDSDLQRALSPARFLIRELIRGQR